MILVALENFLSDSENREGLVCVCDGASCDLLVFQAIVGSVSILKMPFLKALGTLKMLLMFPRK